MFLEEIRSNLFKGPCFQLLRYTNSTFFDKKIAIQVRGGGGGGYSKRGGVHCTCTRQTLYKYIFFKMHFSIKSIACELIKINLILGTACSCSACTDTSTCALQFA